MANCPDSGTMASEVQIGATMNEDQAGRAVERSTLRRSIENFGAQVDAYFAGCDSGVDRARQYIWCVLRPALSGLDLEERTGFEGRRSASDLLQAARKEFQHIRGQLDPVGGPSKIRSIEIW